MGRGPWRRMMSVPTAPARRGFHKYPGIVYLTNWNDLTFTRASEASFFDPRRGEFSGDPATAFRAAMLSAANKYQGEEQNWTTIAGSPTLTLGVADPFGGTDAITVEDGTVTGYETIENTGVATVGVASGEQLWWAFGIKEDAAATCVVEVQLMENGTTSRVLMQCDPVTGAWGQRAHAGQQTVASGQAVRHNGWWLYSFLITVDANFVEPDALDVRINPAIAVNTPTLPASPSAGAVGAISFYGPFVANASDAAEKAANSPRANWLTDNVARIFSDGAILIEGARTNLSTYSADIVSLRDAGSSATVGDGTGPTPPDGSALSDTVQAIGTSTADGRLYGPITGTDDPTTLSVFEQKVTGTEGGINSLGSAGFGATDFTPTDGSWTRRVNTTTGTANKRANLCAQSGVATAAPSAADNEVAYWGIQMEAAAYASSPIRTSGATATRAAEGLTVDGADLHPDILSKGFAFDWWPNFDIADIGTVDMFWSTASDYIRLGANFTMKANALTVASVSLTGGAVGGWSAGDKVTIKVDWVAGTMDLYVNGVLDISDSWAPGPDWSTNVPGDASVYIGWSGASNWCDGVMSRWRAL